MLQALRCLARSLTNSLETVRGFAQGERDAMQVYFSQLRIYPTHCLSKMSTCLLVVVAYCQYRVSLWINKVFLILIYDLILTEAGINRRCPTWKHKCVPTKICSKHACQPGCTPS